MIRCSRFNQGSPPALPPLPIPPLIFGTASITASPSRCCAATFPALPCYEHFVALQKSAFVPLVFFLAQPPGDQDRAAITSTPPALPVCDNHRINRHKVFAGLAQRGKTSMGWFFGFKLHLVFNNRQWRSSP